jgi:hypothetical protein
MNIALTRERAKAGIFGGRPVKTIQKTTLEYWALIAEIAGAIAIVVSVIYLGVQIRANTKVLRSQAHYNALSLAQRPFEMAIADQGLADLIEKAYVSPEKLNEGQWFRCSNYWFMQFNSWGISVLSKHRRLYPQGTLGRRRRLLQRAGRNETGTQAVLVRVPTRLRRSVSFLRD